MVDERLKRYSAWPRRKEPGAKGAKPGSAATAASLGEGLGARAQGYALIALVSAATLVLSREGALAIILGGAATSAVFLYGFAQFNPRWVGLELIVLTLAGYFLLPGAPAYWLMGSALAGGLAAILTKIDVEEDDQFFLPALTGAVMTFVLFTLGQVGGWADSLTIIAGYIESYRESFDVLLALPENAEFRQAVTSSESWDRIHPRIGLVAVSALIGLWVLVLWLFNRFARRRMGRLGEIKSSLLLFRVRPMYTFVLIVALVLEILSLWLERRGLSSVSYPLIAASAAAFLVVHLGVAAFWAALWRASSERRATVGPIVLIVLALAISLYVGPIIGLADVWFDFRKTRLLRGQ